MSKKKKYGWGGRRPNQNGRPPIEGVGTVPLGVSVTQRHVDKVNHWRKVRQLGKSEAVREMIDLAPEPEALPRANEEGKG